MPLQTQDSSLMPSDNLGYAIFVCLCCCWPIGIAAIIRSCQCRTAKQVGNVAEAQLLADKAKCLAHAALITGLCFIALNFVLRFVLNTPLF